MRYWHCDVLSLYCISTVYWGADKSLARPGGKQGTATEDFDVHISYLSIYLSLSLSLYIYIYIYIYIDIYIYNKTNIK